MGIFKAISKKLIQGSERRGQRLAQAQLLRMSDRELEDFGISRLKLLEGISAWPWTFDAKGDLANQLETKGFKRVPAITNVTVPAGNTREVKNAINELKSYSDRELAELGVTRHSIEEAVRYGRPAIEGVAQEQRHVA